MPDQLSLLPANPFAQIPDGPDDPILGVAVAFQSDVSPHKINLGIGAYRTEAGLPYVLNAVRSAEEQYHQTYQDKEYPPFAGIPEFVDAALKLAYGAETPAYKENRIAAVQSISGTGALRCGAGFFHRFYAKSQRVYLPNPSWGNHATIFHDAGLEVQSYRYYDRTLRQLDIEGMLADLAAAPSGSIILLHACAHNPTGVDPTQEEWRRIEGVIREKKHAVFFDMAYQGFASGDCDEDAYAVRLFVQKQHYVALAQSFSKNMGLYGERVGTFSLVTASLRDAHAAVSQLKFLVRGMYSFAPIHGAGIAAIVMNNGKLNAEWKREIKEMAERIKLMRSALRDQIESLGSKMDWRHITSQIGMFCYTGLSPQQCERLCKEFHVYLPQDGRISIAGINSNNVKYLASAIHQVTST